MGVRLPNDDSEASPWCSGSEASNDFWREGRSVGRGCGRSHSPRSRAVECEERLPEVESSSDIGAGFEELYGSPGGITDEAMGVFPIDDTNAYLVRARSVYQMSLSGNVSAPFRFDRVLPDIGSPFRHSISTAMAGVIFASRENIHLLDANGHKLIGDLVIDDILDLHASLETCYAAFDPGRLEYRFAVDFDVWRYRLQEQGWTRDNYPFKVVSLSGQLQGKTGLPIDALPGIIDGLSLAFPPGSIDDLLIRRDTDNGMIFVPESNSLTMWETDALTDWTVDGVEIDPNIELETGVVNSDPFNACELHEIHLEYETKTVQQLLFDATVQRRSNFPTAFVQRYRRDFWLGDRFRENRTCLPLASVAHTQFDPWHPPHPRPRSPHHQGKPSYGLEETESCLN